MTTDKVKHCDCGEITCPHRADYLARLASKEIQHSPIMTQTTKFETVEQMIRSAKGARKRQLQSLLKGAKKRQLQSLLNQQQSKTQEIKPMAILASDRLREIANELADIGSKFPNSLFSKEMNQLAFRVEGARFMLNSIANI